MIRCRYVVLSARKKKSNCCELIPVMLRQAGLKETQWYGLLAWLGLAKWLVAWLGSWLIYPMMAWKSSRLTAWQWFGYRIDKFFSDSLPCMRTTIILCTFTCKMHSSALYSLAILDLTLTRPATSGVAFPYQSINGKRMFLILRTSRMPNLYIIYIYIHIVYNLKGMVSYASMIHTGDVVDTLGKDGGRNEGSGKVSGKTCGQWAWQPCMCGKPHGSFWGSISGCKTVKMSRAKTVAKVCCDLC